MFLKMANIDIDSTKTEGLAQGFIKIFLYLGIKITLCFYLFYIFT